MSLTVKGILEKTFKRSFKGYDEDEVDQFLDQVIDEMKSLEAQIKSLKSENAELGKVLESEKKHRETIREAEETIMHTLVSAQKSSERILHEAARKAELIIDSAESTARQRALQTDKELEDTQLEIDDLRNDAKVFAGQYTSLINTSAAAFAEKYAATFGDKAVGGINAVALDKINKEVSESLKDIDGSEDEAADSLDVTVQTQAEPVMDDAVEAVEEPAEFAEAPALVIEVPAEVEEIPVEDIEASAEVVEASVEAVETAAQASVEAVETAAQEAQAPSEAVKAPAENSPQKGLMELHEINQALNELEQGEDILPDSIVEAAAAKGEAQAPQFADYKQKYNDYSWLYESDGQPEADDALSIKDPEKKDELKSLIDEIID